MILKLFLVFCLFFGFSENSIYRDEKQISEFLQTINKYRKHFNPLIWSKELAFESLFDSHSCNKTFNNFSNKRFKIFHYNKPNRKPCLKKSLGWWLRKKKGYNYLIHKITSEIGCSFCFCKSFYLTVCRLNYLLLG